METPLPNVLLPVGLALALGACASFPDLAATKPEWQLLAQVHPGLTQNDVRAIAGKPDNVTGDSRAGGAALWIYDFEDLYGERSEFDVTFNADGLVASTYSERLY